MGLLAEKLNNLDKIDKILIATVFIVAAILSPVFADEEETVTVTIAQNVAIGGDTEGASGTFVSSNSNSCYFVLEEGYSYTIYNNSTSATKKVAFSNDIPVVGGDYYSLRIIEPSSSITIDGSFYDYVYVDIYSSNNITVKRVSMSGQKDAIDGLSAYVGVDNIWETFNFAVPYIAVVVVAVFGLYIIKRLINGLSKGKGRI